jgi:hypothetical protein
VSIHALVSIGLGESGFGLSAELKSDIPRMAKNVFSGLSSIPNPLHVLEQNLLSAPVIEFRGPAVGMAGDPLSGFKGAVIFQKIRDAGRPE